MEYINITTNKRKISLIKKTELMAKYRNIYKAFCPNMHKLTNEGYQVYLESINQGDKESRVKLLNAMLINIFETLANIYVNIDLATPFEDNISFAYEVYYDRIMKCDEFPKSISKLTSSTGKILFHRICHNDEFYKKHNIDLEFEDIERNVDTIKVNENNEFYDVIFNNDLKEFLISQINKIHQASTNPNDNHQKKDYQRQVVLDYFGLLDGDIDKTLKTLAKTYNVSSERIRKIINIYFRKLSSRLLHRYSKEYLNF